MQKTLEQIHDGKLCPSERSKICAAKFCKAKRIGTWAHNQFEQKLDSELKEKLNCFLSLESDVTAYHREPSFMKSLRLKARLILVILEVEKNN